MRTEINVSNVQSWLTREVWFPSLCLGTRLRQALLAKSTREVPIFRHCPHAADGTLKWFISRQFLRSGASEKCVPKPELGNERGTLEVCKRNGSKLYFIWFSGSQARAWEPTCGKLCLPNPPGKYPFSVQHPHAADGTLKWFISRQPLRSRASSKWVPKPELGNGGARWRFGNETGQSCTLSGYLVPKLVLGNPLAASSACQVHSGSTHFPCNRLTRQTGH